MNKNYRIQDLEQLKSQLIQYIEVKIKVEDWHSVSDAANDLREIEVELRILQGK